jgi:hypothetical protein
MKLLAVYCIVLLELAGCSLLGDLRDSPWDPRGGSQLIDQIPNWDSEAMRSCGDYANGQVPRC